MDQCITFPIHPTAAGPFEVSGFSGYRQVHCPRGGRLFAFEPDGHHLLTCDGNSALIYSVSFLFVLIHIYVVFCFIFTYKHIYVVFLCSTLLLPIDESLLFQNRTKDILNKALLTRITAQKLWRSKHKHHIQILGSERIS